MPKFSQQTIEEKKQAGRKPAITNEMIEEYIEFVKALKKGNEGRLEFGEGENINKGRKALIEAGVHCRNYVKVRKSRGEDNVLTFVQITKQEFQEAQAKAKARGEKVRAAAQARSTKSRGRDESYSYDPPKPPIKPPVMNKDKR